MLSTIPDWTVPKRENGETEEISFNSPKGDLSLEFKSIRKEFSTRNVLKMASETNNH
jgi:hypothetical protein